MLNITIIDVVYFPAVSKATTSSTGTTLHLVSSTTSSSTNMQQTTEKQGHVTTSSPEVTSHVITSSRDVTSLQENTQGDSLRQEAVVVGSTGSSLNQFILKILLQVLCIVSFLIL